MRQPFRFAIVGAGFMGGTHARAVRSIPGAQISVVCSRTPAPGRALADACQADWTSDYHQAVARRDVDIVSICTPSGFHLEPAEAAARHGKHLIIEKPLEISLDRADRAIRAAQVAGVKLACIFPYRFHAGVAKAKEAVDAGRLGRMTLASCHVKWYRSQDYYDRSWHGTRALDGGGALINQSIHSIDLLQYLAGPVDSVIGSTATLAHKMESEDTAVAVLRFHTGALGVIEAGTGCWPGEPARIVLHGEHGTIALEEGRIVEWRIHNAPAGEAEHMRALEGATASGASAPGDFNLSELHRRQIMDLLQAIESDRQPAVDGREGRKAVEIIQAIYASAANHGTVQLPLEPHGD